MCLVSLCKTPVSLRSPFPGKKRRRKIRFLRLPMGRKIFEGKYLEITFLIIICSLENNPVGRETLSSSRAKVTSMNSHSELFLPNFLNLITIKDGTDIPHSRLTITNFSVQKFFMVYSSYICPYLLLDLNVHTMTRMSVKEKESASLH